MFVVDLAIDYKRKFHYETDILQEAEKVFETKSKDAAQNETGNNIIVEMRENGRVVKRSKVER